MLWICEKLWNVKHKMVVKSCRKCRIRYPFNGTKDFVLFEESESLVCNRRNGECDSNDFREFCDQ